MAAPVNSGYLQSSDPTKPRSDAAVPFRDIIPSPTHPRIAGIEKHDALSWCESRRQIEAPAWLIHRLDAKNLEQPYKGFTSDGTVRRGVYAYAGNEGAPTEEAASRTEVLLQLLSEEDKKAVQFGDVTADEFRLWSNPELYMNPGGLRLDQCKPEIQSAIHSILQASFSPQGYEKVLGCCLTNDFLGHLVNGKKVLNEHSYNFRLFGTPSLSSAWGYTFFGHHLCLAVVFLGKRMVIGPTFMGAEPDRIDEGPHAGLRLFRTEEMESLRLMQGLPAELQGKATLSKGMDGKSLPADRWNPFDERHLGGARQDNRVVPYEGCPVSEFPPESQDRVFSLFLAFNEYYPTAVLEHRLALFKKHLPETYFAWIGEFGDEDPYYYRIHSPVAFMELDFHCGIFLTNTTPARCHIHTVNRLPNRGDYGKALLEQ
ncbi:hypothetical protein BJ875DRAFT_445338 [Amylocarpus encephaloides]|uniref:Uncharacterized protein n=1 Tax=Amylocarpus encephaloides TaxID=45428 RepID=A0A9P8C1M2_9HELO|nr:hypothetical protein BJ875DRAFT_445338 [Amylocarpus encephaloides]